MTGIPFGELTPGITANAESDPTNLTFDLLEGSITINADTIDYGSDLSVHYTSGAEITITMETEDENETETETTTNTITVAKDVSANITLNGVKIDVSSVTNGAAAFSIENDSTGDVTVTLVGENELISGSYHAGLQKNGNNGTLTIKGDGSLYAESTGAYGAGIGAGGTGVDNTSSSNITILGGKITVKGGRNAAGIGGSGSGSGSNITISGGTVEATGGRKAAGIGGGNSGSGSGITISGGTVNATGGSNAAGIGGGASGDGSDIKIIDGTVNATGGSNAAGIGGGNSGNGSGITINNGTVTATGGNASNIGGGAAGIGGGNSGNGSNITINNGTVTATGGDSAAGIGGGASGNGSNIKISDGTVTVDGKGGANDIGNGENANGAKPNIEITGGSVKNDDDTVIDNFTDGVGNHVYPLKLETNGSEVSILTANNERYHAPASRDGKPVYVYLPAGDAENTNKVTVNGKTVEYYYDTISGGWLTATVRSISIKSPIKTEYFIGDDLDVTGGVITAHYEDGRAVDVEMTVDMITGFDSTTAGKKTLTVTYEGNTAHFDIEVLAAEPGQYIIASDEHVNAPESAKAGDTVSITVEDGYKAIVKDESGSVITEEITGTGTFIMPESNVVITSAEITAPDSEHTHEYSSAWSYDSTEHWHQCSCGEKSDIGRHISNGGIVTVRMAVRTYSCTVCGYVMRTETIPDPDQDSYPNYDYGYNDFNPFLYFVPRYNFEKLKLTGTIEDNSVILRWTDIKDADEYTVYQFIDGKYKAIKTTTDTTYTVESLATGEYKFIVRYTVNDRLSPTAKTNSLTAVIKNDKPYPTATVNGNVVTIKWQAVDDAEKYAVYLVKDGKAKKLKETDKRIVRCTLKPDKEYRFVVRAYVEGKWTVMKMSDIIRVEAE